MRKLAIALTLFIATAAVADHHKFEGSYRGPDESYGLVLENRNGQLGGTYVEAGRVAVLHPIRVEGEKFTATASFDDGSWRTIEGKVVREGIQIGETYFENLAR